MGRAEGPGHASMRSFADEQENSFGRLRRVLHRTPSRVPLVVLLAAIVVVGRIPGDRFFSPRALIPTLQQAQIVGGLAAAPPQIILISHTMPHVFEPWDKVPLRLWGKRLCVIGAKTHSMSDAVATMTGAKGPDQHLENA